MTARGAAVSARGILPTAPSANRALLSTATAKILFGKVAAARPCSRFAAAAALISCSRSTTQESLALCHGVSALAAHRGSVATSAAKISDGGEAAELPLALAARVEATATVNLAWQTATPGRIPNVLPEVDSLAVARVFGASHLGLC